MKEMGGSRVTGGYRDRQGNALGFLLAARGSLGLRQA